MERFCLKSMLKLTCFSLIAALYFAILELGISYYFTLNPLDVSFSEKRADAVHFDPILGFRMPLKPLRFARRIKGQVEFLENVQGNSDGFPSKRDFLPKTSPEERHIAIMGDSFTAAQYLPQMWPEYVESHWQATHKHVQLLNYALSGAGLGNWEMILKNIIAKRKDTDAVVFAVYSGDLQRRFTMLHHDNSSYELSGISDTWDSKQYPKTLQAAAPYLKVEKNPVYLLEKPEFERALKGEWHPPWNPFPLDLYRTLWNSMYKRLSSSPHQFEKECQSKKDGMGWDGMTLDGKL